ncbi:MAG: peptide ABC transporter substrate-binding protein [Chloroflexota bacterium]
MKTNKMLFLLLTLAATIILAACGGGNEDPIIVTRVVTQEVAGGEPVEVTRIVEKVIQVEGESLIEQVLVSPQGKGDTLNLLYWQVPNHLNVYLEGSAPLDPSALTLEPLARYDETGQLVPWLAAEVPTLANGGVADDLRSITWTLRENIRWADETPLTANDVAFTVEYCQDRATGCIQEPLFAHVFAVEVIDDLTIKIYFDEPTPNPYGPFVGAASPVLQQAQFAECLGALAVECRKQNEKPVGTGPYKVDKFSRQTSIIFEPNDEFRDPFRPFFSQVIFNASVDATTAASAVLEMGSADYAWNVQVQPQILQEMIRAGNGQAETTFGSCVERVMVNLTNPDPLLGDQRSVWLPEDGNVHPILGQTAVRQALSLAIDRPELVNQIYGETAQVSCNILPAPNAFTSPNNDQCKSQNISAANVLLDEANIRDLNGDGIRELNGLPLQLTFRAPTNPQQQLVQADIQAAWQQIGVATTLESIAPNRFFSTRPEDLDTYSRFYADVQMYTDCFGGADPEFFLQQFTCAEIALPENNWHGRNISRYCNPLYEEMMAQFSRTGAPAERAKLGQQMNDLLVQDGVIIPLVQRGHVSVHANSLLGVRANPWDSAFWNIADWYRSQN